MVKETNSLIKLLELFPEAPWDSWYLSKNPNITWEFVKDNPDKTWSYSGLSANPEIKWSYYMLSQNKFKKHPCYARSAVKPQPKELIQELHSTFDMPPGVSNKPVFKNGGIGFHENWNEIELLNTS